jgi:hypothetical protein
MGAALELITGHVSSRVDQSSPHHEISPAVNGVARDGHQRVCHLVTNQGNQFKGHEMKTFALLTAIALASLTMFSAGLSHAGGSSWGLGGAGGLTLSGSGAAGLSSANQLGSSTASSAWEGYGKGEATFQGSYGNTGYGHGNNAKFKGAVDAASGSLSNASTTANGNGVSSAVSLGGAFGGGLSIGGAGQLSGH